MNGYDAWLEAPYDAAERAQLAFERWCDANDVDERSPEAQDLYDEWCDAQSEE